jgi:hypothetical protein
MAMHDQCMGVADGHLQRQEMSERWIGSIVR